MIALKAHPQHVGDPERHVFVPLTYGHHDGRWVPIMGPEGYCTDELEAARACHAEWLRRWREIRRLVRQVRAYCEHPGFAHFADDGIDAGMITTSAQQLADAVELGEADIARLFATPANDDIIRIGGLLYELDPASKLLQPLRKLGEDERTRSPDAVFLEHVYQAIEQTQRLTLRPLSRRGIEYAIDELILMLPADGDESDEREPAQLVADHRFARHLGAVASKVYRHTGRKVSLHGLQDGVAVLQRLIEDREAGNDNGDRSGGASDEPLDQVTAEFKRPDLGGVVQREIDDEAPAYRSDGGDLGPGDGSPEPQG